ncbi:MAG: guanylate kinase [Bacteroidetes bacterium]|nr:MAG: guanylate kinase [Bacteroidota bacterium]PTM10598.1 MAG: guanylate kinase [Bacteroidota bacterium]
MSKMLIFTAPSGAGKTTIVRHLLRTFPELAFSVSATTRPRRPYERDGYDYYFISPAEFQDKVAAGDFVEWEEVYEGLYYGTLHSEIDRLWAAGKHVIFDIEVKGARNLKNAYPAESLVVFVKPPSPEILFERLRARQTEDEESLAKRIARAAVELTYEQSFDRVLLNDDLAQALAEAEAITRDFLNL